MYCNNEKDKWEIYFNAGFLSLQNNTFTHIDTFVLDDNYSHLFYVIAIALTTLVSKGMNTVGVLEVYESNKNYLIARRHREVVSADLAKYRRSD